jgi:hypothetical protein
VIEIVAGFADVVSKTRPSAVGRSTLSPCVISGAVTMKTTSSTSITSTSGVTLMSAIPKSLSSLSSWNAIFCSS